MFHERDTLPSLAVPELPEVETIRRQLAARVLDRPIVDADAHPSEKFQPATELVGATIVSLDRRGKYLLAGLHDGRELIVHLGMTGQLLVEDPFTHPEACADPHVRAWWRFADGGGLRYRDVRRFGRLRVVPGGDHSGVATLAGLGPEPFDDAFTALHLHAALRASNRRVKTQLLSQRPVAGLGNIYADEALWRAGVHPGRRRVTRAQCRALHAAIVEVLQAGLDHGGTTLRDYRSAEGATGSNQHHLDCYGRAGSPCRRCGETLRSRVYDARTTTFCATCQR